MYSYTIVQWLFFFYFYCFFGWCFESTYVSLKEKRLVNRGFMRGPFLPLYGSGGIMMLVVSAPFQGNTLLVYLAGCVGATVLEYVTGVAMEALFKVRYWDYSKQKFNFQGHICLKSTLAWGFLTIFMTEWLHKTIEGFALQIPMQWMNVIVVVVSFVLVVDFTLSFNAAMELRDILIKMEQAREELQRIQKRLDVIIAVADEDIRNKHKEITEAMEKQRADFMANLEAYTKQIADGFQEQAEDLRLEIKELTSGIEAGLDKLKELLTQSPAEHLEVLRSEMNELRYKYRSNLEKREYFSKLKGFYKKNLLQAHPSMTSDKFKEALAELKEKAKNKEK